MNINRMSHSYDRHQTERLLSVSADGSSKLFIKHIVSTKVITPFILYLQTHKGYQAKPTVLTEKLEMTK